MANSYFCHDIIFIYYIYVIKFTLLNIVKVMKKKIVFQRIINSEKRTIYVHIFSIYLNFCNEGAVKGMITKNSRLMQTDST